MGLAGLFVCMNVGGKWEYNLIGGQGWLAVALVIFARWNPLKAIGGSLIFGILLRLFLHVKLSFLPDNCEALLMMLPYVITLITLILSGRKKNAGGRRACRQRQQFLPGKIGKPPSYSRIVPNTLAARRVAICKNRLHSFQSSLFL